VHTSFILGDGSIKSYLISDGYVSLLFMLAIESAAAKESEHIIKLSSAKFNLLSDKNVSF